MGNNCAPCSENPTLTNHEARQDQELNRMTHQKVVLSPLKEYGKAYALDGDKSDDDLDRESPS
jgi:hypothetical protein